MVVVVAVAVDISKISPRRNPSLISASTWKRKCVYASMAVVKVMHRQGGGVEWEPRSLNLLFFHIVVGKLMGYDPLLNLVLDETVEYLKGNMIKNTCG